MERIHFLGTDKLEHAHAIQRGVNIEGVEIVVVTDRDKFGEFTEVPESIPQGHVLISFDVAVGKNMALMRQMYKVLNPPSN
jgi:hypothetical protein